MSEETRNALLWVINALLGIIGFGIVVWLKHVQAEIFSLRQAKHDQSSEIAALRVLVAGDYLRREEFREIMAEITHEVRGGFNDLHKKLDSDMGQLYDELRTKADKIN